MFGHINVVSRNGTPADPTVLRSGLLGLLLATAPLTVILSGSGEPAGADFDVRPYVFLSDVPLAAVIAAAVPVVADRLRRRRHRALLTAGALLGTSSLLLGVALAASPSLRGLLVVYRLVGAAAVAVLVSDLRGRMAWKWVLTAMAILQGALAVLQLAIGDAVGFGAVGEMADPFFRVGAVRAPQGTLPHPYVLAALCLVAGGVLSGAAVRRPSWPLAATAALAIAPVGFTYSRAAGLGAALLVLAVGWGAVRAPRTYGTVLAFLVAVLAVTGGLMAEGWASRVSQTTTATGEADLTTSRGELVDAAMQMIASSPVLGVGPGRYVEVLPDGTPRKPVHNVPLLAAAEGGIVAGLAMLAVIAAAGWAALREGPVAIGLWAALVPLLLLDHLAYSFPVGMVLLGVWAGALDSDGRVAEDDQAGAQQRDVPGGVVSPSVEDGRTA